MKNIFLILFLLLPVSCQWENESVCYNRKIFNNYRIPLFFNNDKYYLITSLNYPTLKSTGTPLSSLITYNVINDSITIKKVEIIGVPLVFHKSSNERLFLITSKCFYSVDENNNLVFEKEYNNQVDNQLIGKTIYEYKDDKIYLRPGIDNPNFEIFAIDQNNLSPQVLNNKLILNKFNLIDLSIPKSNKSIDFVFTDGTSYFILKDEDLITKKIPSQDRIHSISYNNLDNEICLGTTNGNIYYDDFRQIRINSLKDGSTFPSFSCFDDIATDIDFSNDIAYYCFNYDFHKLSFFNLSQKIQLASTLGSFKSLEYSKIFPYKNGNLVDVFSHCGLYDSGQESVIRIDRNINDPLRNNFYNIEFMFNKGKARINKKDTSFTKSFNY